MGFYSDIFNHLWIFSFFSFNDTHTRTHARTWF